MNMSMMQELPYLHKYSIRRVTDRLQAKNTDYAQLKRNFDLRIRQSSGSIPQEYLYHTVGSAGDMLIFPLIPGDAL
jgi:hypothetical protein